MTFRFNGILNFNAKRAIANMKLTKKEMEKLRQSGRRMSKGFGQLAQGAQGAAFATAPFAIATGLAIREAVNFEAQMSTVRSVLLATKEEMIPLEKLTQKLGATTAFTAQQAGEGSENLARAGFTTNEIMSALPAILDAAAASGVGLAEASDVVASNIGAFGFAASDATKVADILALTTARTNTNFTQLAQGLKLAAPIASQAGISFAETASTLGVFSNAGIKGTLGATALRSALNKLAKPTKEAIRLFGGRRGMTDAMIRIGEDGKKRLKPMEVIMANIAKAVQSARDPLEAAGQAAEILGIRGTTAFSSFQKQILKTIPITDANRDALIAGAKEVGENIDEFLIKGVIPKLVALRLEISGASGSAKEMARIRLDNVRGQFVLLQSAVSGLEISFGTLFLKSLKGGLRIATDAVSGLVAAFQILGATSQEEFTDLRLIIVKAFGSEGADVVEQFVAGVVIGTKEIISSVKSAFATVRDFLKPLFKGSEDSAESFGNIAAKILLIGAIAAPILAGIVGFLFVMGPVTAGVVGVFNVFIGAMIALKLAAVALFSKILIPAAVFLTSVFGFWLIPIIAVIAAFIIFRKEIMQIVRVVGTALLPIWEIFKSAGVEIFNTIKLVFTEMFSEFKGIFFEMSGLFTDLFGSGSEESEEMGITFKEVLMGIQSAVKTLVAIAKPAIIFWLNAIVAGVRIGGGIFVAVFSTITTAVKAVITGLRVLSTFFDISKVKFNQWKTSAISAAGDVWDSFSSGAAKLWATIKASFIDPMRDAILELPNLVATKINAARDFVRDKVPGAGFFFGDEEENKSVTESGTRRTTTLVERASADVLSESLRQKRTTAPASANDIGQSVGKSVASAAGGGGQSGSNINVSVDITGRISGRDLNLAVTRQQVEVAEKNGIHTNPTAKRKVKQNGQMLTGTGT